MLSALMPFQVPMSGLRGWKLWDLRDLTKKKQHQKTTIKMSITHHYSKKNRKKIRNIAFSSKTKKHVFCVTDVKPSARLSLCNWLWSPFNVILSTVFFSWEGNLVKTINFNDEATFTCRLGKCLHTETKSPLLLTLLFDDSLGEINEK